jgi:hypothetical protein
MAAPLTATAPQPVPANGGAHASSNSASSHDHRASKPTHSQTVTPEPRLDQAPATAQTNSPNTPGHLAPYNWEDFEARYRQALHEADENELEILAEFDQLVKVASFPFS